MQASMAYLARSGGDALGRGRGSGFPILKPMRLYAINWWGYDEGEGK